ncbi:uncharacterized protein MELLADRAFT_68774 [Melampsora larici-populina 98AG31]|uniref:Uncharacterized protein n=1 Tax=Melampsora larici-populina (strain 98AG31 / pathotype 3-4-7) TaxID=747676 RepID=F4S844_MELLP|nr:uncharacterized protein MELLADRAFT_68774 [Melampsora larici-populina 98AG31]EGF99183.1 hypothetical protein MELLADRAFT_68774 [Melampsora larici-populina 98AG31]
MQTRRRDYAANPRSPPKRRKRTPRNKQTLPELATSSNLLPSYNLSLLPPLPPSPLNLNLSILPPLLDSPTDQIELTSTLIPDSSQTHSHIPLPPSACIQSCESNTQDEFALSIPSTFTPESEIADSLSRLTLTDNPTKPYYTVTRQLTQPSPLSTLPFENPTKLYNPNPIIFPARYFISNMSTKQKQTSTTLPHDQSSITAQDITEAKENLGDEIKFESLTTNGSNFIEWKKNTARAIKALLGIKNYWEERLPVLTYIDRKRDGLAMSVINNTIHNTLKNVTDDADSAYDAMDALQNHFRRGGRTAQFSLFNRLMNLRLDLNETEMINHMSKVDSLVSEIESTGFIWNSESIRDNS